MARRLIEAFVPAAAAEEIRAACAASPFEGLWSETLDDGRVMLRILTDASHSEAALDAIERVLAGAGTSYRLVVLPVEAVLPPLDEPAKSNPPTRGEASPNERRQGGRVSRAELYEDLRDTASLSPVFLSMTALATVVAGVGLAENSVALVLAAMVLAPLLGPLMAMGLATTLADPHLAARAVRTNGAGVVLALTISVLMGALFGVEPGVPEIALRVNPGVTSVLVGLAAGAAGAIAMTSGVPAPLIGVMVAVALLPPTVAMGMLFGAGFPRAALGAGHLLAINVVSVNLAAVGVFLARGVRPRLWWHAERARRMAWIAMGVWAALLIALGLLLQLEVLPDGG